MKAMILAAGLGTRLGALTAQKPKALASIQGRTLLEIVLRKLAAHGFDEIIINVHHFAGQIKAYLAAHRNFGLHLELSDESGQLLDTGGGVRKAAWFFDDGQPFLVHNVDIVSDIDLAQVYAAHRASGAMATLCCTARPSSRHFLFNAEGRLCGWQNVKTGERKITVDAPPPLQPMAFNGIHVIDPALVARMPQSGAFSIVDAYLHLSPHALITCFAAPHACITDAGTPEALAQLSGNGQPHPGSPVLRSPFLLFPFLLVVKFYQLCISPLKPPTCRFAPTCSQYALEALRKHGLIKGLYLSVRRVLRCHPWGGHGYDPVP
ncbi:MAG: membrane protein insertion efficiency factor YidD [Prevotellaceae bacterium]|jgi:putative membrane protein insertion efficiency factor|nr:membrane protein insertion efficiency factor YidD [Prevotellaceae bacterium]